MHKQRVTQVPLLMVIPWKSPASNQRHQRQLSHKVRWAWDDGLGRDSGRRSDRKMGTAKKEERRGREREKKKITV